MKLIQIAECIERIAPLYIQESYDNCGILLGNGADEVTKALIALDLTEEVLEEALEEGCDVIITHHPFIFSGVKKIDSQSLLYRAIQEKIAIYAAHTNLDSSTQGVSRRLAQKLGVVNLRPLSPHPQQLECGLGVVGELSSALSAEEFLAEVQAQTVAQSLRHSKLSGEKIRRVALCGGAGASLISEAIKAGAQAYVTGDLKYHDFDPEFTSILRVDVGHFESEQFAVDILFEEIRKNFPTFAVQKTKMHTNFVFYR